MNKIGRCFKCQKPPRKLKITLLRPGTRSESNFFSGDRGATIETEGFASVTVYCHGEIEEKPVDYGIAVAAKAGLTNPSWIFFGPNKKRFIPVCDRIEKKGADRPHGPQSEKNKAARVEREDYEFMFSPKPKQFKRSIFYGLPWEHSRDTRRPGDTAGADEIRNIRERVALEDSARTARERALRSKNNRKT